MPPKILNRIIEDLTLTNGDLKIDKYDVLGFENNSSGISSESDHSEIKLLSSTIEECKNNKYSILSSILEQIVVENKATFSEALLYTSTESNEKNFQVVTKENLPSPCFQTCLQCRYKNSNPYYQYCDKCFKYRKQLFEQEPGPKPRRVKQLSNVSTDCKRIVNSSKNLQESEMIEKTENTCNICFLKPKNGVFNHNKTGHVYCCYSCSKRIWNTYGKCPICKTKIRNVTRIL